MKTQKRAIRRTERARRLARAKRIIATSWFCEGQVDHKYVEWAAQRRCDNMQVCSNPTCCGNPRRLSPKNGRNQLTLAERKSLDYFRDSLEDYLNSLEE